MTRQRTNQHPPAGARRATAMSEMVLVLPFIVMILAFVLYFGRGIVRVQHAEVMDRYEAWREAANDAPGPHPSDPYGHRMMNETFYAEHAASIGFESDGRFPPDARLDLADAAAQMSNETADLANEALDNWPKGRHVEFSVRHDETVRMWQPLNGPIRHGHTRIDNDWRFANHWQRDAEGQWQPSKPGTSVLRSARDVFYEDYDSRLDNLVNQNNDFARMLRDMLVAEPAYVGPKVRMIVP